MNAAALRGDGLLDSDARQCLKTIRPREALGSQTPVIVLAAAPLAVLVPTRRTRGGGCGDGIEAVVIYTRCGLATSHLPATACARRSMSLRSL